MEDNDGIGIEFVRELASLLDEKSLTEIEISKRTQDGAAYRVRLSSQTKTVMSFDTRAVEGGTSFSSSSPACSKEVAQPNADPADHPGCLLSPMVGTIYIAQEPGAAPFVQVGDHVEKGQVVLIIEAMKTMNYISAHKAGQIEGVFVKNAQPVEYHAPLLIIAE
jgi:acetyl-CoA carboxylase biotin carboxyl carrier protein